MSELGKVDCGCWDYQQLKAEVEQLRERGDAVVHTAREVMHGRMHTGQLLEAMNAWEGKG